MNCRDRCATDEYDSVIRRLEEAENKNLDQDNAISEIRRTIPDASVVDTLTIDVDALQDEKLDNAHMDEDIHFGPVTITKDGTAVIASFDAINPVTGETTPMSILLPGATSTDAGVMDASSVAWIEEAEGRISALEGLSDVKALVGLSATPTQAEINAGWMDATNKPPETGDLVQDVSNSKLWVYVTDTWIIYGTLVTVPLATTNSLGGIKDTALTAPANRWYCHVEADGRLSLIGGDALSTLLDTTIPATQTALDGKINVAGTKEITGVWRRNSGTSVYGNDDRNYSSNTTPGSSWHRNFVEIWYSKNMNGDDVVVHSVDGIDDRGSNRYAINVNAYDSVGNATNSYLHVRARNNGDTWVEALMRATPGTTDVVNTKYVLDRVDELVGYVNDQDANSVKKTGDQDIAGSVRLIKTGTVGYSTKRLDRIHGVDTGWYREERTRDAEDKDVMYHRVEGGENGSALALWYLYNPDGTSATARFSITAEGEGYGSVGMRSSPEATDMVNKAYLDARLNAMTTALAKAGMTITVEEPSKEELQMAIPEFDDDGEELN